MKLSNNIKGTLISVFVIGAVLLGYVFLPESDLKEPLLFVIALVVFFGLRFLLRSRVSEKEKVIRSKIKQLKSEGQDLAIEQESNFNEYDLKQLNSRKRLLIVSCIGGTLALSTILIGVIQVISDVENKLLWQSVTLIVILGGLGWLFIRDIQKLTYQIRTGRKTVVRGIVTNKRIESDETNTYFLEIDSLSVFVKRKVYNKYEIGDGIEIHIFKPRHNMLLYETRIESLSLK